MYTVERILESIVYEFQFKWCRMPLPPSVHKNWFYKFLLEVPGSLLFQVFFFFVVLNEISNAVLFDI